MKKNPGVIVPGFLCFIDEGRMFEKKSIFLILITFFTVTSFCAEHSENYLQDLPTEILATIAGKLQHADWLTMRLVKKDLACRFFPWHFQIVAGKKVKLDNVSSLNEWQYALYNEIIQAFCLSRNIGFGNIALDLSANFSCTCHHNLLENILHFCAEHEIPLNALELSDNRIQDLNVRWHTLKSIRRLDLSYNKISDGLLDVICHEMTQLETLLLDDVHITHLPESIELLKNLHILDCQHNDIKQLPKSFANLQALKILRLSCNPNLSEQAFDMIGNECSKLEDLELPSVGYISASIKNLTKLQKLRLGYKYEWDPDGFSPGIVTTEMLDVIGNSLPQLKKLEIVGNPIFPESMANLKNVKSLHVHYAGQLSREVLASIALRLPHLERLNFSCISQLAYPFPPECKQMKRLKKLVLSRSLLPNVVRSEHIDWICQVFSQLEELNLQSSKIRSLPKSIRHLTSLHTLNLWGCKMLPRRLYPVCRKLPHLQHLNIRNCELQNIPQEIGNLSNLKTLRLGYNPLSYATILRIKQQLPKTALYR